ncbi:putative glycine dehydrogenase (decarboxylating) subunit 2 [Capsulimonas corticalis]|uniref:Probable glycine dehydrogenase (decarboxylating) subunit 2 n=1 Tax=Capsulimonas corticalis TaxID=2219043 RepID=A0A402CX50_9BACT|nr:aminomethyl-transferring glycine dehydrogenase subunit GcvPB [Capsulimonas corticalis]BDI32390.1 putative glycine dehydrogenase (decarboxylating) subunit 2 [Capsulimonas corticalis]
MQDPSLTHERLLFEISQPGRLGVELPECDVPVMSLESLIPSAQIRKDLPLPELSEPEVIRHFTHLSQKNYSVDSGFYPLGSCTMKYNPKVNEEAARHPGFARLHPYLPDAQTQGALEVLYDMQNIITEIAGMDATSLQPAAGAHGELLGLMLIKAYHEDHGQGQRDTIIVPEAAHGTNPASAARCGYKTLTVKSDARGRVDLAHLKSELSDKIAGLMLTNPNTLGLFEDDIAEICDLIHGCGGLVYCDGANMNALVGRARPGDMGFDVMHFNLHKTFSSPHGGGGPGSGPVAVKAILEPYLPTPQVVKTENGFVLEHNIPKTVGKIHGFYGSFLCILRSYLFILYYGKERLKDVADNAVLNANYIRTELKDHFDVAFDEICMHEVIFSAKRQQREHGVRALDVAKRLMDFGYHPPTIYFPLIVPEALMIEPTETESRQTLDSFIDAMKQIAEDIVSDPEIVKSAPHFTPVRKLDEALAARQPCVCWSPPPVAV